MGATIRDKISYYAASGAFSVAAQAGDFVLVIASGYSITSSSDLTVSDNGSGGSNTYNLLDILTYSYSGYNDGAVAYLAAVTHTGTLTITCSGNAHDVGFVAYLLNGITGDLEAATHISDVNGNQNPLLCPGVTTNNIASLFSYYVAETGAYNFSSFTMSQTTDFEMNNHYHASGHLLDVAAGYYTPGLNVTQASSATGTVSIFLKNTPSGGGGLSIPVAMHHLKMMRD